MAPGAEPNDHMVHFLECTTPWAMAYLWTGNTNYLQAALGWHDLLARDSMQPSGVPVADEYYGPMGAFRGTETCDVAGYVWSQIMLLSVTGQGRMADRVERAFFNAGPATVTRDFKKHVYFQSPNRFVNGSPDFPNGPRAEGGTYQTKHSPLCCTAALNRIVPWYVTHMWMATYDNGLAATCYGPCKVTALVADRVPVAITCATDYPFNETIEMTVALAQATAFPLSLHIPGWCAAPEVRVNGSVVTVEQDAHGFVCVSRLWQSNDTVRLSLPMTARVETGHDYNASSAPYASVSYGPLLFARAIPDTTDANTPDTSARWKFALDVQNPNITVARQSMPPKWDWPLDAPLKMQIHAVAADWNPDPGAPTLPNQPIVKQSLSETITLVPYGCTKFRISMFPVTAAAEVNVAAIHKILFLGNSITLHPPAPDIGWTNNWGMAASEEAKDYVHRLTSLITGYTGTVPGIMVRNIADFERNYATYDVEANMAEMFAFAPDLVVLAIGENVSALSTEEQKTQFKAAVMRIFNGVLTQSQPIIAVRSCFWADAAKDLALSQVCQQAGGLFVDIGALGADESNYARSERTFSNSGVGAHPGDKGMAEIASAIYQTILAQSVAGFDTALLIDSHRTTNMAVTADAALGTVINAGRIIKTGGARLTVTNAVLANGTVEVRSGTLALGDGACELPEALRGGAGLAFWVDANCNVATDESGTVTNWYDVREAEGGAAYPRARPYGSEPAPTLVTGGDDVAGLKLVDFGAFPSGRWLQWQSAGGYRNAIGNIRAVFLAISCTNGTGFLLGDWTGSGWGGNYCFHVGGSFTNGLDATWWYTGQSPDLDPVRWGLTFVDGLLTDGMRQFIPHTGTVLSVQTVSGALASNFCNDRNLKTGNWGVQADRQGGGRIGEALIYTAELTEGQRKQVEAYLMKKWLRKPLGAVRVAPGATLAMSCATPPNLSQVTGAGTLEVADAGHVTLPDTANIAAPPIALGLGASASGTLCRKPGQPFALAGGSSYAAANGVCARTALTDGTLVSKTGGGVLTVSSIDGDVSRINVAEGTLRLSPPLPGTPDVLDDALENGSFETHDPVRSPNENGLIYIQDQTDTGWTYTDGSSGTGNCGLARYGSAFCNRQPPDGDWVLFLVNDCTVAQNFTAPVPGRYEISFRTAATINSDWMWHVYQVLVDGTNVVGSIRTSATDFERVVCRTPALSAGAHTLCFRGIKEAGMNRVSLVDAVEQRPCADPDEVEVPNGGFESPTLLTDTSSPEKPYAYFQHEPSGAGWTFVGAVTGTTEGYGTWRYAGMDEGGHAAILCTYNGGGVMSVPLTFPSAGLYRVTFLAACRTAHYSGSYYNTWSDGAPLAPVSVTLGMRRPPG